MNQKQRAIERYVTLRDQYWSIRARPIVVISSVEPATSQVVLHETAHTSIETVGSISGTVVQSMYSQLHTSLKAFNAELQQYQAKVRIPTIENFRERILPVLLENKLGVGALRTVARIILEYRYQVNKTVRSRTIFEKMVSLTKGTDWRFILDLITQGMSLEVIELIFATRQRFPEFGLARFLEILEGCCEGDIDAFEKFWDYFESLYEKSNGAASHSKLLLQILHKIEELGSVTRWMQFQDGKASMSPLYHQQIVSELSQLDRHWYESNWRSDEKSVKIAGLDLEKIQRGIGGQHAGS